MGFLRLTGIFTVAALVIGLSGGATSPGLSDEELVAKYNAWAAKQAETEGKEAIAQLLEMEFRIAMGERGFVSGKRIPEGYREVDSRGRKVIQWESKATRDRLLEEWRTAATVAFSTCNELRKGHLRIPVLRPEAMSTGQIGDLRSGAGAFKVAQVLSDSRLLIAYESFKRPDKYVLLEGVGTKNLTDGAYLADTFSKLVLIEGTETYPTPLGSTNTVFVVRPIPTAAGELKPGAEARGKQFAALMDERVAANAENIAVEVRGEKLKSKAPPNLDSPPAETPGKPAREDHKGEKG